MKVFLSKAEAMGEVPVEKCCIEISGDIPVCDKAWKLHKFYRQQAETLCDALQATLPGGTVDSLLAELMERKASQLRVAI